MRNLALVGIVAAGIVTAEAQSDLPYLDNRSTPEALVESLYNAVNRKEYGRAWSYYGEEKPAANFDAYLKGFEATEGVKVMHGEATSEGAAGSVYYTLPVAIESLSDGAATVFAGCYTIRLANPDVQAENFVPMHIVKGKLEASTAPVQDSVPESCPEG